MTAHRRYLFTHPDQWKRGGHKKVLTVLERACASHWWFKDPKVMGQPFNLLQFSFTVSARDQWWAHRRALDLGRDCFYAVGLGELDVPLPEWETLAPHTNRGRWRVPTASV